MQLKIFVILIITVTTVSSAGCPVHGMHQRKISKRNINNNDQKLPSKDGGNGDRLSRSTSQSSISPNQCNPLTKYQTIDGSCNNLINPNLGRRFSTYKRYLLAEYSDGTAAARTNSVNGGALPNPRLISRTLMNDNSRFESDYSHLLVFFGQFLAHDLTEFKIRETDKGI